MSALSPILRSMAGGRVAFWCPGCDSCHAIPVEGPKAWGYNGNPSAPTISPSILVTWEEGEAREKRVCHSFVRDGSIQFLGDCTHALAGQTVPLPVWPLRDDQ